MWLINTRTIKLEHIVDAINPAFQYAILSHTWEDSEPTFQDLQSGRADQKAGYDKILKTCELARKDGIRYAWIDTVCINKESSAELTEAINSMWRWYREATICYAYLKDVKMAAGSPELKDGNYGGGDAVAQDCHEEFAKARWFTRGWCLQELIAPQSIVFYDSLWSQIGTKKGLLRRLWRITGIDPLALENSEALSSLVIARKMSWAAGRQTTRVEDRAYSLLGLFGVNMPLLYGEGEKAFVRLQEEIIKNRTDHSIFAWDEPNNLDNNNKNDDLIFASSPDQFKTGRRMIRWMGDSVDLPFRLTNRGIAFEGLFFVETATGCYGALNCRYEDDLRGILALRLCQQDEITSRYNKREIVSQHDFWVPTPAESESRLIVYTGFDNAKQYNRPVTLLRYHPAQHFVSKATFRRMPKFWIILEPGSPEDFDITDAYPAEIWNTKTRVMCPPATMTTPVDIIGSVVLKGRVSGHVLSLAFRSPASLDNAYGIKWVGEFAEDADFRMILSCAGQEEARKLLAECKPDANAQVDPGCPVPDGVSARVYEVSEVLGDVACLIAVCTGHSTSRRVKHVRSSDAAKAQQRGGRNQSLTAQLRQLKRIS